MDFIKDKFIYISVYDTDMELATNQTTMDQRLVLQRISNKVDYFMITNVTNETNECGNMKVTVKLDDGQDDVKYDGAYSVTPTKEITVNSKV
jgi:hypothetical protein